MTDLNEMITVVIPYLGTHEGVNADPYLPAMIRSLPVGMRYMIAANAGKHEMAQALNLTLANVTTEFVLAVGADDKVAPDMVDLLFRAIGTADIAYPSMQLFAGLKSFFRADLASGWRLQDQNLCGVFLARTDALREVGGWQDELYEDWDLMYRLWQAQKRFVPVPEATYHYRIHKGSLSHRIMAEADKLGVDPRTLAPKLTPETRVPMLATFYAQQNKGIAYLRSELPARYLPGVATQAIDIGNKYQTAAAIFEYPANHQEMREVSRHGRAVIVDTDDNYLTPSLVQSILSSSLADREALAAQWKTSQPEHRKCVRMADAVIAATAELAMVYSVENKNTHLIPNSIDPTDWSEIHPLRIDDKIRIVWPAGRQHLPDAHLIEPAMRWASQQPNVEVLCIGLDPGWDFEYAWENFTPSLQVYRDLLSLADIVVAPVIPTAFNRCKSDIKWLEAAMVGAAFVGSKVPAYDTVWHESNGLLARGKRDFERWIKDLVHSADMRLELGAAANKRVLDTRDARLMQLPYLQVLASCGVGAFEDLDPETLA